jgi:hypothetical protein
MARAPKKKFVTVNIIEDYGCHLVGSIEYAIATLKAAQIKHEKEGFCKIKLDIEYEYDRETLVLKGDREETNTEMAARRLKEAKLKEQEAERKRVMEDAELVAYYRLHEKYGKKK